MSTVTNMMKQDNLIDSIVKLTKQAEEAFRALENKQSHIFGQSPRKATIGTCAALLMDIQALVDLQGETDWTMSHKRYAQSLIAAVETRSK